MTSWDDLNDKNGRVERSALATWASRHTIFFFFFFMQTYPAAPVMMAFLPSKRRLPPELMLGLMLILFQSAEDDGNWCQKVKSSLLRKNKAEIWEEIGNMLSNVVKCGLSFWGIWGGSCDANYYFLKVIFFCFGSYDIMAVSAVHVHYLHTAKTYDLCV